MFLCDHGFIVSMTKVLYSVFPQAKIYLLKTFSKVILKSINICNKKPLNYNSNFWCQRRYYPPPPEQITFQPIPENSWLFLNVCCGSPYKKKNLRHHVKIWFFSSFIKKNILGPLIKNPNELFFSWSVGYHYRVKGCLAHIFEEIFGKYLKIKFKLFKWSNFTGV